MENKCVQNRIFHLDCGRKYFTKDWIIALCKELAAAGYNQLQLAVGNDGLRLMLDDMSVGNYSSEQVKRAVEAGNAAYGKSKNTGAEYLSESEMDEIIAAADAVGIEVTPLLNSPGHMYAILTAMTELGIEHPGHHESIGSVDFENAEAVAFTKGLVSKYAAYFAGKGSRYFNIGADEYANDCYKEFPGMGIGNLISIGKFGNFRDYVNELSAIVKKYGMTARAFNDGFYYNNDTGTTFDKDIQVCYWCGGWIGYDLASTATISAQGHELINTHVDQYYILGKEDNFDKNGIEFADTFCNMEFSGSTVENPAGSMFCIWCDSPDAESEQETAARSRQILRIIGGRMCGKDITADKVSTEDLAGGFRADGSVCAE